MKVPFKKKALDYTLGWLSSSSGGENYNAIYAAYGTVFEDLLLPEGHTWNVGSYNATTEGTYNLTASDGSTVAVNLEKYALKIEAPNTATLFQTGGVTEATTDGHSIANVYDLGRGFMFSGDATTRTLTSTSNFGSFITNGANTTPLEQLAGFHNYWQPLNQAAPVYCIRFIWKFETGSDGVSKFIAFYRSGSGASNFVGLVLERNTSNKLRMQCYKPNGNVYSFTTATSITESSGVVRVTININGVGASAGVVHIKTENGGVDTSETFTVNAGVTNTVSTSTQFQILSGAAQSMGAFHIMPRIATAGEITAWKTYNPTRASTNFLIKNRDLNPSASTKVYSETTGTTNSTNGGIARFIKDDVTSAFGELPGYVAASDAGSPLWYSNGGVSYLEFDGTDDNLTPTGRLTPDDREKFTLFVIVTNDDVTNGSHILSNLASQNSYMVLTGANYSVGSPYLTVHPDNNFGGTLTTAVTAFAGVNIFVVIRDKDVTKILNNTATSPVVGASNTAGISIQQIGQSGATSLPDWKHQGKNYRTIKYSGVMPEAKAILIRDALKTQYGI